VPADAATGGEDDLTPTLLSDRAERIEREHGEKAARLCFRVAQGQTVLLDAVAERWLEWRQYPPRSAYQQRLNLKPLPQRVQGWVLVSEVLMPGRSPRFVSHRLSTYDGRRRRVAP
jgi:hypothetical protein